jgi:Transmembrane domain of unknown function (DUF3566)
MSSSPDDLPEARGRAERVRTPRTTSRTRVRSDVVDAPVVADEVRTEPPPRRTRTDGDGATTGTTAGTTTGKRADGNGAGTKLPRAARRERKEPKVVAAPAAGQRLDRRFRQTITKVDLWSVTKLSLCFYISAMFVTVIALVALWSIADAAGIVKSVEKFIGDLLDSKNFHFLSADVLRGAVLIGLVVVALQVVITVVAASFYNIFAELFGGIEITIKEEEAPPAY